MSSASKEAIMVCFISTLPDSASVIWFELLPGRYVCLSNAITLVLCSLEFKMASHNATDLIMTLNRVASSVVFYYFTQYSTFKGCISNVQNGSWVYKISRMCSWKQCGGPHILYIGTPNRHPGTTSILVFKIFSSAIQARGNLVSAFALIKLYRSSTIEQI